MLLRVLPWRKAAQRESLANVTFQELLRSLKSWQTRTPRAASWVAATMAAVVVSFSAWLGFGRIVNAPGRVIETGAMGLTTHLSERSVLSLHAHSRVRVNDQQRVVYVEAGEVTFEVSSNALVVETLVAKAAVPAEARQTGAASP